MSSKEEERSVKMSIESLDMEPVNIAEGIYWVGYSDDNRGLHCNPYLIIEGDEAVLIDGGNRDDFSTVMLKILRTGIAPSQITRLIYQHYDPDLCGSLPQLEAIINSHALRIISHTENNVFIHYYSAKTEKHLIFVNWAAIMTLPRAEGWRFMHFPIAISRAASLHMIRRQKHCSRVICSAALIPNGN
jgi:glyoxylase-like metal-dependent hydrolase (beta-lactamase superfamily II)